MEKEKEVEVVQDSDDDKEIAEMLGMKHESQFLKDMKKEMKMEVEEEPMVEEVVDEKTPYKAPNVISIDELNLKAEDNIILVLGSEGEGVSKSINKLADYRVMIPPQLSKDHIGKYPFNMIDSLNVGVSAGVLIYHIRHLTTSRRT